MIIIITSQAYTTLRAKRCHLSNRNTHRLTLPVENGADKLTKLEVCQKSSSWCKMPPFPGESEGW